LIKVVDSFEYIWLCDIAIDLESKKWIVGLGIAKELKMLIIVAERFI
jgi:hypothetical protein